MEQKAISFDDLDRGCLPAVVLGDLTLIRPLAVAGIPVVLGATHGDDIALRSRHVSAHFAVPGFGRAEQPGTLAALERAGESLRRIFGRRVPLVYGDDDQLDFLYRHRRELSEHYLFVLNDDELGWALHDKERFGALAGRAGILVPRTLEPGPALEARLAELREPLVVKSKRKTAWHELRDGFFGGAAKARVFATRAELLADPLFRRHQTDLIVQEHIDSDVESLVSFHGFADEHGRLLATFCGRKLRTFPRFAGESSLVQLAREPAVERVGGDIVARLRLKGPFKIDLVREARTGLLYTLEINARFTLWNYLGAVHGVNLPKVAYDYLVHGRAPEPLPTYEPKYRFLNLYLDAQAFREQRARGELGLTDWLTSLAGRHTVYESFAWSDPEPFVRWAMTQLRRKVARA